MNLPSLPSNKGAAIRGSFLLALAVCLAGCDEDKVAVYTAPKDESPQFASADPHAGTETASRPELGWKLPAGWTEIAPSGGIALAAFSVPGAAANGEVSVARLTNLAGKESVLVNMWRESAGLKPLSEEESLKQLTPVQIGSEQGSLFEVAGKGQDGNPIAVVTAMVHRPDGSWFYKLTGDPSVVGEQKASFIEFLKTIRIQSGSSGAAATQTAAKFNWKVPQDWKQGPPGAMQVARFAVPGKAEVSVSVFPSDTGGTLTNVNRWRGQISLPPINADGLPSIVSRLDSANSNAILVDMTNDSKRLLAAVVPREGQYWFYKLLGDTSSVAPQKEAFIAFAKSPP